MNLVFSQVKCKSFFSPLSKLTIKVTKLDISLALRLKSTFRDFVTWLLLWDSDSDGCDIEAPMVELEVPIGRGC